jgi:SAM-dependent methyltransferase
MPDHAAAAERLRPRFWDHQRHVLVPLRRAIERALDEHLAGLSNKTAVDLGCGSRPYESLFAARGFRYIGCDLKDDCASQSDIVEIVAGEPIGLASASAGAVVSFQVLEHVWDLDWYLSEARRLLQHEGWLLLSTHGTWLYHPHPTDYRRWTRDGLIAEIELRGFQVHHCEGLVGPLAWTTLFRLLAMRSVLLCIPVAGRWLSSLLACWMNVRMIAEDWITPAKIRAENASVYVVLARPAPLPSSETG